MRLLRYGWREAFGWRDDGVEHGLLRVETEGSGDGKRYLQGTRAGEEAAYFRNQDAQLIEKLRESARLEEIALALAEKLQVDNPELLHRVMALGVTSIAPRHSSWRHSCRSPGPRGGHRAGVPDSPALSGHPRRRGAFPRPRPAAQVAPERPLDTLFDTATEVIKVGLSVLPPSEQEERIKRIVEACHEVAEASGGLAKVLGLGSGPSGEEASLLDTITTTLRGHRRFEKDA